MKLDIFSNVKNNSGYTLTASFYKRNNKVLETGLASFSIKESISFLSEMKFFILVILYQYSIDNSILKGAIDIM